MAEPTPLTGPSFGPAAGDKPEQLVILLHGVGADGTDLIALASHWAEALPRALFVSPHAPYAYDMAPFGYQWFSLMERDAGALLAGVRRAAPVLDAFIDGALEDNGLAAHRLALVGFSQGAMMALHVGLRRAEPVAAIVAYSAALIGPEALAREIKSRPPVLLVHGDQDPVVPVRASPAAAAALKAQGVAVETHIRPGLGHGIDAEGLALGRRFLERTLTLAP
jgi:phospholipase/carboxylesterase